MKYSVIILSYNEENTILNCINSIKSSKDNVEIILADGGSIDSTVFIAKKENILIKNCSKGRGIQCNEGAAEASGDILLFLHADTVLPKNAFQILEIFFKDEKVKIGTFRLKFNNANKFLSLYTKFTKVDSMFTRFGDQCIVVRKKFFNVLNWFPNWQLFEDVEFLRAARRKTKIHSFPSYVTTSARRFEKKGFIKQQLFNGWLFLNYLLKIPPEKLALKYFAQENFETSGKVLNKNFIKIKEALSEELL
ncbi:MAG: TIGR04283 family arsenosugar biosynthesis glycosyltransferase [Ignavibacteriaceae bacterium]